MKPNEVGKPIVNETSLQLRHNKEFSSFYFTLNDRKTISFFFNNSTLKKQYSRENYILVLRTRKYCYQTNATVWSSEL